MRDDKTKGGHTAVMHFVATQWTSLCLETFRSAFNPKHIEDITQGADTVGQATEWLGELFRFAMATVKRFAEFQVIYQSFPWRFVLVLEPSTRDETLSAMKKEWEFLLQMEEQHASELKRYPFNLLPHVRWYAYREVMTYCAERSFQFSAELAELISSWFPDPVSTLGADEVFRCMRKAETEGVRTGETSPIQLQAVAIKALNGRYDAYETAQLNPHDYAGIQPGMFVKRAVFDSSRASAQETNLPNFNTMCRVETMSPHMISRKCLNLWQTLMKTGGRILVWFLPGAITAHDCLYASQGSKLSISNDQ